MKPYCRTVKISCKIFNINPYSIENKNTVIKLFTERADE